MIQNKIDEISKMKRKKSSLLNDLSKLRTMVYQLNNIDSIIPTLQERIQKNESSIESLTKTNKAVKQEIVTLGNSVVRLPQLTNKEQELTATLSSTEEQYNKSMKDLHNSIKEKVRSLGLVRMGYRNTGGSEEPSYFGVKDEPRIKYEEDKGFGVTFSINYGFEREVKFDNIDTIMDTLLKMKDDCVESFESEECAFALAMAELDITNLREREKHKTAFHDAYIKKIVHDAYIKKKGNKVEWLGNEYTHFTSWISDKYIVKDKEELVKEHGEVTKHWNCDLTNKHAWWTNDNDFFPVRDIGGCWVSKQAWSFMDKYLALIRQVTAPQVLAPQVTAPQVLALRF